MFDGSAFSALWIGLVIFVIEPAGGGGSLPEAIAALISGHVGLRQRHFAKANALGDIIEIVDLLTGAKVVMLNDGRTC